MKRVLITGVSSGIGMAAAIKYAEEGYEVIGTYLSSEEEANFLLNKINILGGNIILYQLDLTNNADIIKMRDKVIANGNIDILVNNAAISNDKDISFMDEKSFMEILDVNLIGVFRMIMAFKDYINKEGTIINMSSTNALDTEYIYSLEYDASKAGVISLSNNFANLLSPIRVNTICPGWIDTKMNKDMDDEFYNQEVSKILLKRFGSPSEVADLIYNISINTYINKAIIRIDGGING